jgi:hypothetical protein
LKPGRRRITRCFQYYLLQPYPDQNSSSSKTIEGYYRALLDKFYVTGSGHRPDSLSAIEKAARELMLYIESKRLSTMK